jgi:hypothetical protein
MRLPVYGNHHDIAGTVQPMLHLNKPDNRFLSRNLIQVNASETVSKEALGFAYYTNENGLGWATAHGKGFYEFGSKEWRIFEGQLDAVDKANAQAYLQTLYNDFLAK